MKKFSILTATYNRAYRLKQTIDSVLAQTHANFEYWVIDDGSTDATPELMESFKDPRLRYIRFNSSETHAVGYPQHFRECSGDYLLRLDSDDRFLSTDALDIIARNLTSSPDDEFIHGYLWIDERPHAPIDYFTGWQNDRLALTFEDFLLGTKGFADVLFIGKRVFWDNFFQFYQHPFNWFTGLWEALLPDGKLRIFRRPLGVAGWSGTDNVTVLSGGRRLWAMTDEYNTYLAERYRHVLKRAPKRLGYFLQWAAYYELLLGKKLPALGNLLDSLRHDPANLRSWSLLALWPLPGSWINALLGLRSKLKWTFRKKGDWRS